ncbi:hypothetical protein ACLOJK_000598 [Asimina triloba]
MDGVASIVTVPESAENALSAGSPSRSGCCDAVDSFAIKVRLYYLPSGYAFERQFRSLAHILCENLVAQMG